ncbi:glycosyltransferase [Paraglaciecola sp. Hal342]
MNIIEDNRNIIDRVVSENDSGIYDALNKGISLATGDVVGFLHSDDTFAHNDVLKHVASLFVQSQSDEYLW